MKVALVDKGKYSSVNIRKDLVNSGFKLVEKNPNFVISYGGDGTFFIAERKYPGVPKLLIKDSKVCYMCVSAGRKRVLDCFGNKRYKLDECIKLKVKNLMGVNDVIIRNRNLTEALRFNLKVNDKDYGKFIGDGLVIATPYGSTGYFRSITRKIFGKGKVGIAFNNTIKKTKPLIVKDNSKIEVEILRGLAEVGVDNNPKKLLIEKNSKIIIKKSNEKTYIVNIDYKRSFAKCSK